MKRGIHRSIESISASIVVLLTVTCALCASLAASGRVPESMFSDMHWRLVGPHRSGWATAVAGIPGNAATFYFGGADGGVWKTTDSGSTWHPLFDDQGSASIGAMAIAATDPSAIWVGTGQIHQRWDVVDGDGVYRSTDGGESWVNVGLKDTKHIGSVWVDPRSAETVLVAALGHTFGPNEQRGIFRTEDGGANWTRVLYLDDTSGGCDIAADPDLPDVVYASLWDLQRYPWLDYFHPTTGPGSGIYKSTDSGRTWTATGTEGLPEADLGRISLAVAPGTDAQRVWASVEAGIGAGLYRSEDGGATWNLVNDDESLTGSYMSWLLPEPATSEVLWAGGQPLRRSEDGGESFTIVRSSPGGDDYHALWIDPTAPHRMITGADQGAVITHNGGKTWSSWYNQPTGQFYRLAVDNEFPYRIYSGQQDSGTIGIASRSDYGQITFRDWSPVGGDERDGDVPDPTNPDIVYGAGLGGRISKWNRTTGQVQNVSPWPISSYAARPGTTKYRYDWITPLAISARAPHAIYVGAQVLFRSLDGGHSWETISPDLTGAVEGAAGCDGDVSVDRATDCGFGVIFAIAPSALEDGLVWIGTTNGKIQLTRDDGATWSDVTPPGLPDWSKVNIIDASRIAAGTAYVAVDRHRADDFRPMVYRTHDYGETWTEISNGLPDGEWVGAVRQDHVQAGLLFAGTSRTVHVSFDDGANWQSLKLDLPTSGVNDLLVHEDDVIVATEGRAIWILDSIAPLRHLAAHGAGSEMNLVEPATAWRLRFNQNRDTPLPLEVPRGENPPAGATFDYLLPADVGSPVTLEIFTEDGRLVRRFQSDEKPEPPNARVYFADAWLGETPVLGNSAGHNRFVWDLRYPAPQTLRSSYSIAAVPHKPTPVRPEGAFVLPGQYEVHLTVEGETAKQALTVAMDPRVETSAADLETLHAFQREIYDALESAVMLAGKDAELPESPAAIARVFASLAGDLESADLAPTQAQEELFADTMMRLAEAERRWAELEDGAR